MIYNLPLRLTTLHLAQRLRMEGATFMSAILLTGDTFVSCAIKFLIILAYSCFVQSFRQDIGQNVPEQWIRGQSGEEAPLR
jgi:hypothetical protein